MRPKLSALFADLTTQIVCRMLDQKIVQTTPSSVLRFFSGSLPEEKIFWIKRLTNLAEAIVKTYRHQTSEPGKECAATVFSNTIKLAQEIEKQKYFVILAAWSQWVGVTPHPLMSVNKLPDKEDRTLKAVSKKVIAAHFQYQGLGRDEAEKVAVSTLFFLTQLLKKDSLLFQHSPTCSVTNLALIQKEVNEVFKRVREAYEVFQGSLTYYEDEIFDLHRKKIIHLVFEMATRYIESEVAIQELSEEDLV